MCEKKSIINNEPLNIWLIKEGEDLPMADNPRLMRMGSLAKYLSSKGHKVIWWSSSFIHGSKKYYVNVHSEYLLNEREKIVLLHSNTVYQKNISLKRIRYHKTLAKEFIKHSEDYDIPDIILCAWPTPQFAKAAVEYGRKHGVPVLIDIRDFWPEIYIRAFPRWSKNLAELAIKPLKKSCSNTLKKATGIVGKEQAALEWGCNYAGRKPGKNDRSIFIGNEKLNISESELNESLQWWKEQGVTKETWNMCFFSTLSLKSIDLETVIRAVLKISLQHPEIRLIIGGRGDGEEYLKEIANNSPNVVFGGWLNKDQMNSAMLISKCGLYCLKNTDDFKDTFTNKAIQYLSAGLPILNSLTGFSKTLLAQRGIGITYKEQDVSDCEDKILYLLNNEAERKSMCKDAERTFNSMFESSVINQQFEGMFYSVINNVKENK